MKATKGRHIPLVPGAKAPAFELARDGGGTVSLTDFAGRKLALFFFPRAGSAGCTQEAIGFSVLAAGFAEVDTAVLGVSPDAVETVERFKTRHALSIPLACDPDHRTLSAYGVWGEKSLYGKSFMGVIRTTFLIDQTGRITRIWPKVKIKGHAEAVLAAARDL